MLTKSRLWWRYLPAWLLGAMVVIGLGLEAAVYDNPMWAVKLPLAALLLWLWRATR